MPETTKTYADRLTKSSAVFFIPSGAFYFTLKSATPFPKCYLHKEKWTFDS